MIANRTFKSLNKISTGKRLRTQKHIQSRQAAKENFFEELTEQMLIFMSEEQLLFFKEGILNQTDTLKKRKRETQSLEKMKSQKALHNQQKMEDSEKKDLWPGQVFHQENNKRTVSSIKECFTADSKRYNRKELSEKRRLKNATMTEALPERVIDYKVPKVPKQFTKEQSSAFFQLQKQLKDFQRNHSRAFRQKSRKYATNRPHYSTMQTEMDLTSIPRQFLGDFSLSKPDPKMISHRLKTEPESDLRMDGFRSDMKKRSRPRYFRLFQ